MTDSKTHWENIYTNKSPLEVSWYQGEPALSLQLIRNTRLAPSAPIIDVGGGASLLVDCLLTEGYTNIAVLDLSAKALAYAQERLGGKAGTVEWYDEDITRFAPPHTFSLWHDRAVFHFLTDESDRKNYLKVLKQALAPGGHLIIAAFALGGPTQCSGLEIVQYDAEKLMGELGDGFELIEELNEAHITPQNKAQKFVYFHFIRKTETSKT